MPLAGSPSRPKDGRRVSTTLVSVVALCFLHAGCGSAPPTVPSAPVTVTATQKVTETVRISSITSPTPVADTPTASAPAPRITVPNGVGMNYQAAQDLWRSAGLHVSPAIDATGANRLPVVDSNWVVLAQDLKAGSKVSADSFITATVKKYTDN